MARHSWIAFAASLTSSAFVAIAVWGEAPSEGDGPAVRLLAPEFGPDETLSAPRPARLKSATKAPLGLGYPSTTNTSSTRAAQPAQDRRQPIAHVAGSQDESDSEPPLILETEAEPLPPSTYSRPVWSDSETAARPIERRIVERRRTPSDLSGAALHAPPYTPSNQDEDALPWTASFEDRAAHAPDVELLDSGADDLTSLPTDFEPWWGQEVHQSIRASEHPIPVDVDMLVTGALQHSPQVLGIRTQPEVDNAILCAENAAFDWTSFVNTKWDDLSDPVGSTLTTGNASSRFIDQVATVQAGLRRRNEYGGEFEASQKWGWQDNNSEFLQPKPQGTTRLQLNYTQPLLNGSGTAYNQARIVLAQIELNRSFDVVQDELQTHLVKVTEAYWDLYRSRAIYLQRKRVYASAETILETLGGRQEVDALQRQVNRAKAAVASRRSEIVRSQAAIRNAESRLRLLVNDPQFLDLSSVELLPIEAPRMDHVPLSLAGALQQALQYRPDISQAVHDLRGAGVRLGVSQKELLPKLDLVLTAYVAGLEGDHNILGAWGDQYSSGRPGYTIGTQFEMPLGNRAAQARQDRRQWELTKAVYDFRTIVETGLTDVELTVREAETSYREMVGKFQALIAAETEASYLEDRWKLLPGGDRSTTLLLEDMLDAQQRLADTEGEFVNAEVSYSIALIRVRRAMGTLMIAQNPTLRQVPTLMTEERVIETAPNDDPPPPTHAPDQSEPIRETKVDTISRSAKKNPFTRLIPFRR